MEEGKERERKAVRRRIILKSYLDSIGDALGEFKIFFSPHTFFVKGTMSICLPARRGVLMSVPLS